MVYISKRELKKKAQKEQFKKMYDDVCSGSSWQDLAVKYGYKNANTARVIYYRHVVPYMKTNV